MKKAWRIGDGPGLNLGAGGRNRTADLLITNELLYQLSYAGQQRKIIGRPNALIRVGWAGVWAYSSGLVWVLDTRYAIGLSPKVSAPYPV